MFQSLGRFIRAFFVKIMTKLPESPFDVDEPVQVAEQYLAKINYFIPCYLFVTIFKVWVTTVFASFGLIILFKYLKATLGK